MRFLKSISLCMFVAGVFYLLGRTASQENQISQKIENGQEQTSLTEQENMILTVSEGKNATSCDTVFHVKTYDMVQEKLDECTEKMPVRFMGLSRKELEREIALYEESPSFEDLSLGLVSMELISYAPDEITVFKTYQKKEKELIYYMKLEDNQVVIYRSGEEEVFMTTELPFEHLPDDLQQEIIQVKCFDTLEAVYDFLESYSS